MENEREREREMSCNGGGAREIINGEKVVGRAAGAAPELLPSLLSPRRRGQAGRPAHRVLELHLVQAFARCLVIVMKCLKNLTKSYSNSKMPFLFLE